VGRFADHDSGQKVTFYRGKQGTRSPLLSPSVTYVQKWRRDHPAGDDPDAPLWTRTTQATAISNNRIRDIFKEAADRADMTPPSTPTPSRMRKSSASHLASQGVSQPHLEDHHGWDRGSSVAGRYIAVFSEANDRAIARAHGVEVDETDEPDPTAPETCPRCNQETPRHKQKCVWCGQVRSPADAAEIAAPTFDVTWDNQPGDERFLTWFLNTITTGSDNERERLVEMYIRRNFRGESGPDIEKRPASDATNTGD